MRKILALCCLMGILLLSVACAPTDADTNTTTAPSDATTTTIPDATVSTDDTAWGDDAWAGDFNNTDPSDDYYYDDDDDYVGDGDDYSEPQYQEVLLDPDVNPAQLYNPQTGGADKEAEALRQQILDSEDNLVITGTTYYISPNGDDMADGTSPETAWKTLDSITINSFMFEEGDAVLFERDGIYRLTSPTNATSGVTYGAYGEGAKPAIYGSMTNYAWGRLWEPSRKENVWKTTIYASDAGLVVFDHGKYVGDKKLHGLNEFTDNFDYYHNKDNATLYLYYDKGYPNVDFESIEIGTYECPFVLPRGTENVHFDNLAVKYAGLFAFDIKENTYNTKFTNLEIGWVGGCQGDYGTADYRYGNGIQWWENTDTALVENCWVYQVYDAGLSPQGVAGSTYKDIVLRGNLIEFCSYTIEWFDRVRTDATWDNWVVEDNILRFAGYGFAGTRPDTPAVGHYVGWTWNYDKLPGRGVVIKNNIFDVSYANLVYWYHSTDFSPMTNIHISGNSFYQKANPTNAAIYFGANPAMRATNQQELEAAIAVFDKNPKVVKWLT